jgi:hypothetical protein
LLRVTAIIFDSLDVGLKKSLYETPVLSDQAAFRNESYMGIFDIQIGEVGQDIEAEPLSYAHMGWGKQGSMDTAGYEGSQPLRRPPYLQQAHIFIWNKVPPAQGFLGSEFVTRAEAADGNDFPFKILWRAHFRNRYQDVIEAINVDGNDLEGGAVGDRRYNWYGSDLGKIHLPGN